MIEEALTPSTHYLDFVADVECNDTSTSPRCDGDHRPTTIGKTSSPGLTTSQDLGQDDNSPSTTGVVDDKDAEEDDSSDTPKYQFRPQTRELKGRFTSTWIDQDQTGDYDPSEEFRSARLLRKRAKLRPRHRVRPVACSFDEYEADNEVQPKVVPALMVKLSFPSESARTKFHELVRNLPLEPRTDHAHSNGYHLRQRNHSASFTYNDNYDLKSPRFASELPDDPTGHPFARGCRECHALGDDCPLLLDESAWPCATCIEDGNDCELVTTPVRKRACERCKKKRISCLYSYTLNHGTACQQCMDDGHSCVAGPAKDAIRTRIRYDRDWVNHPLIIKEPLGVKNLSTCAECRETGYPCSFASASKKGEPCVTCKTNGDPCTLENLIPQRRRRIQNVEATEKRTADEKSCPSPGPSPKRVRLSQVCEGNTRTIHTKFCHPVSFNCDEEGEANCHFCADVGYGILGLEKKEVEVIDWEDGHGLDEISGGHKGEGVETTRMCTLCTTDRLSIIMCSKHQMQPIAGLRHDAMTVNDALTELLSGTVKENRQWCAICPSPAIYECEAPGEDNLRGCGLVLCEPCMLTLVGSHDVDLHKMLPELQDEPSEEKMLGLRADYELLKRDGLLMRYVLWSNTA